MLKFLLDFRNARFAVLLLVVLLAVAATWIFRSVLLPFFLAGFLAYLLDPVVTFINEKARYRRVRVPRGAAVLIIYAVIATVFGLSGYYGVPKLVAELNRMILTLPAILNELEQDLVRPAGAEINRILSTYLAPPPTDSGTEDFMPVDNSLPIEEPRPVPAQEPRRKPASPTEEALRSVIENYVFVARTREDGRIEVIARPKHQKPQGADKQPLNMNRQLGELFQDFRANLEENMGGVLETGRNLLKRVSDFVFGIFLVFMLAGFILVDPGRIRNYVRSLVPDLYQPAYEKWVNRLDSGLSGVVRGQIVICFLNGTLTGIGIFFLKVPFWFTLSIAATIFSLIPIFGVLISTIPILIMALTVSLYTALLAVAWILLIHFLEGNFFNPKILGDAAKIHPVLIVFALVVGQFIAGVTGALLAVPIFSLLYNSIKFLKTQAEEFEHRTS